MNKFVFKIALPVLLFEDLAEQDFAGTWNGKYVLFCFVATLLSISIITLLARPLIKNKSERGEFIQGAYRSSAALLGMAFIHNIYGEGSSGMGPLMIIGSVPVYNIFAVTILMLTAPKSVVLGRYISENNSTDSVKKEVIKKTAVGIIKNPILIGIFCGLIWSLLKIPMPKIMETTVSNIGALATPLGLMSMGATFDMQKALNKIKPTLAASFIKLFALVGLFMPVVAALGFRNEQIIAILVMLGSGTTVSSFVMAKNMGHDGTLSSSIIMMTTFGCSFSLTFWLFVLKSLHLI
jgi:predicted permease